MLEGVESHRPTLAGWTGSTSELLASLTKPPPGQHAARPASKPYADDMPVPCSPTADEDEALDRRPRRTATRRDYRQAGSFASNSLMKGERTC